MSESNPIDLLADLAQTILDEPEPDNLVAHIALKTLRDLECRGAILGVIQREGFLDLIGSYGYDDATTNSFRRMPLWTPMPITESVRTGELNVLGSVKELIEKFPSLAQFDGYPETVTISGPIKYRNTVIGAFGFTCGELPPPGFADSALTKAALSLGGLYLRNFMSKAGTNNRRDYSSAIQTLTARQKQIIRLFKDDLTTDQMADRLRYSSSTIKQDIIRIYSIFGVNSRAEVIELAGRIGMLDE